MKKILLYYAIAFEPCPELRWFLDEEPAEKFAGGHPERAEFYSYYKAETFEGSDIHKEAILNLK